MKLINQINEVCTHIGCLTPLIGIPLCFTFGWRKTFLFFLTMTLVAWITKLVISIYNYGKTQ